MKLIPVEEAIGMLLAHDMTQILPGEFKGVKFKKGHQIRQEDIPVLLTMGKEHIGIIEYSDGDIHENDAAIRMAKALSGRGIRLTEPSEGKVSLIATKDGLLKVNVKALFDLNMIEDLMIATQHTHRFVEKEGVVGGTRIIPLITSVENINKMEEICKEKGPIIEILPLHPLKVGIITTGSEVYHKRIVDKFGPVIRRKVEDYGCTVIDHIIVNDDAIMISDAIAHLLESGAELITCTGGMSVDPDDVTPLGIRTTGAKVITYGAPVLPGAMFMLAYKNNVPIVGLPGCVMYSKQTIFDLILPRILAKEVLTKEDIVQYGHGGLCLKCTPCTYPNCSFGRG